VNESVKVYQKPFERQTDTVARKLGKRFLSLVDTNLKNRTNLGTASESLAVQLKYTVLKKMTRCTIRKTKKT
jgi:hypothetical protein